MRKRGQRISFGSPAQASQAEEQIRRVVQDLKAALLGPVKDRRFDAFAEYRMTSKYTAKTIAQKARIDPSDLYKILRGEMPESSSKIRQLDEVIGFRP